MTMSSPAGRFGLPKDRTRTKAEWPDGKRVALYVAVGIEHYEFDGAHTEDLMAGVPKPDLVNASWRDYGNRVGASRLLQRISDFGIAPTVLLNTGVYDEAPGVTDLARSLGAEFVGHGVSNSDSLSGMDPATEREYLRRVSQRIRDEEGSAPRGWSSPWLTHTENTIDLLPTEGYDYVLDFRMDDQPVWLNTNSAPLLAIPYALELNDSTSMIGRQVGAAEFADMIIDEFDELIRASHDEIVVMSVVVHSFISGVPFRLAQLTRALEHLTSRTDVWLTQPRHIYDAMSDR